MSTKKEMCYNNIRVGKVVLGMIAAINDIGNIVYEDETIKSQINKKPNSLYNKLIYIIYVIQARKLMKNKQLNLYSHFSNNKNILNGNTVIKGTRIAPETIVDCVIEKHNKNANTDEIYNQVIEEYPTITKDDINASLVYFTSNISCLKILFK